MFSYSVICIQRCVQIISLRPDKYILNLRGEKSSLSLHA